MNLRCIASNSVLCLLGIVLPARADSSKTMPLRYELSANDHTTFPDGCGNPYRDVNEFMEFYEATIEEMAAEKGAANASITDLFAISEMRAQMKDLFPNLSEESPLDRLIMTQLCQFQKIQTLNPKQGGGFQMLAIHSGDASLHEHLSKVAPKLFKDARKLVVESLTTQAKLRERMKRLALKKLDIRRARERGQKQVQDLFSGEAPQKELE